MWFFAVLIAKIVSLFGVGALLVGLFLRSWKWALVVGLVFGVLQTILLTSARSTPVELYSRVMGIVACSLTALIGWALMGRRRQYGLSSITSPKNTLSGHLLRLQWRSR